MGVNRKSFISGINYFPFNFLQSKSHIFLHIFKSQHQNIQFEFTEINVKT